MTEYNPHKNWIIQTISIDINTRLRESKNWIEINNNKILRIFEYTVISAICFTRLKNIRVEDIVKNAIENGIENSIIKMYDDNS